MTHAFAGSIGIAASCECVVNWDRLIGDMIEGFAIYGSRRRLALVAHWPSTEWSHGVGRLPDFPHERLVQSRDNLGGRT